MGCNTGGVHCTHTHAHRREMGFLLWACFNSYSFLRPIYPIIWTPGWQSIWFDFCTRLHGKEKKPGVHIPRARTLRPLGAHWVCKACPTLQRFPALTQSKPEIRGSNEAVDNCLLHAKSPKKTTGPESSKSVSTFFPSIFHEFHNGLILVITVSPAVKILLKLTWGWRKLKITN